MSSYIYVYTYIIADAAKLLAQAFISTRLDCCNALHYGISDNLYRRQAVQKAAVRLITPTQEGASKSRPSCSSYIGFHSANVCNSI